MSAEAEFYKRHYNGGIAVAFGKTDPDAAMSLLPGGRYALVAERLAKSFRPDDAIVELGCGNAQALMLLSKRHSTPRVTGIDVAFKEPQIVDGVEFRSFNLNDRWPIEDRSVNHLIAMMVFEHLFDPFHSFEEVRRTLAPNGTAYVNLPLVTDLRNRLRILRGQLPVTSVSFERWFEERGWDGNHLHYFSVASVHRLAAACGLRVGEIRGVGRMHALKTALPNLLASEITFSLHAADEKYERL